MKERKWLASVVYLVLGAALFGCGIAGILDEFWSGLGGGFMGLGIAQLVRWSRYRKNEEYREAVDTARSDERNKFLSGKAWAWAGYSFVILNGIAVIPLKLLGHEELMMAAACSVCVIILFYWVAYLILRKKY